MALPTAPGSWRKPLLAAATAAHPPLSPLPPVKSESRIRTLIRIEIPVPESPDPEPVEGPAEGPEPSRRVERIKSPAERAERQRRNAEEIAIQCRIREIEHLMNTSGHMAFSLRYPKWPQEAEARRAYALRLIKAEAEAAERQKIASAQRAAELAARPTRPPRRFHSSSFAAQGKPMFY